MKLALIFVTMLFVIAISAGAQDGEKLIKESDCSSCHAVDRQVVGPAYTAIAKSHAGQTDAADTIDKLAAKIRDGGGGMTPHPDLTDAQRTDDGEVDSVANRIGGRCRARAKQKRIRTR